MHNKKELLSDLETSLNKSPRPDVFTGAFKQIFKKGLTEPSNSPRSLSGNQFLFHFRKSNYSDSKARCGLTNRKRQDYKYRCKNC